MKWNLAPLVLLIIIGCGGGKDPGGQAANDTGAPVDTIVAAIRAVDSRIIDDPSNPILYAERARLHLQKDSLNKAVKDFERSLQLDSSNVPTLLEAGDLFYKVVKVDAAQQCFAKAAALDPQNTKALLKLAEIQLVLRNYKAAMARVNEALRIDANASHGYYLKGWIHMESRDTALAISSFRTAIEQDPQDYNTYIMLGKLSAAKHDPLAEQYYNTAIELRPKSVEAYYNKGMYAQEHGLDSVAIAAYEKIMELDSLNALAWYNRGWVRLEHLNDFNGAKRDFSNVIRLQPNLADAWYNRGVAMERTNQLDSAAANYQVCLSIQQDHQLAIESLGRLAAKGVHIRMKPREKK
jgi:tetratricopeptide (TPR) repeat protein